MDPIKINGQGHGAAINEISRLKLQDSLRAAAESLETPHDTMLRLFNSNLEIAVVRTGCDLGLFKALADSSAPVSVKALAASTGADELLLGRILRYLASIRLVVETGKDQFTGNNCTAALANPAIQGAMYYTFHIGGPAYQALPDFLREWQYAGNTHGRCAWQKAVNTDLPFFPWVKQHPEKLAWFQQLMSVPREGDWLDVVPFAEAAQSVGPERALFVDVGGSIGHQSARLRARYPDLPGRIIVQDLQETIQSAPPVEGVEFMTHDFFRPQPIQGARFYYLRTVLHDWDDDKAVAILQNLIPAMSADSQILIDDMALPNTGVHWWSACLDLHMYTMLGALERNEDQWRALLDRAGLKLVDIRTYMPVMRHSIIVAELKE
ncbi:hypothetical protein VTN77DRAFT_115 [Rasamsonia byssochlamydoides]|uniref:uncharacterized protein n=1 Tax=Rasamsonia byssochlamydoides TaxID=89139 RepID=UPI003743825E